MLDLTLLTVAGAAFLYALLGRRLSATVVTAPMIFLAVGFLLSEADLAEGARPALAVLAEITLVVVLFSDAARLDAEALARGSAWPARMLIVGLPLAVLFGTLAAVGLMPGWTVWEAAVLAAVLAPTDAALVEAVVTNRNVPERIRRTLGAESGLNDGLALPIVLFFAFLAAGPAQAAGRESWLAFAGEQIGLGFLVGLTVGLAGARLLLFADARRLTDGATEGIAVLALAAIAYLLASLVGGNGFIAAFVAGLAFGRGLGRRCRFVHTFMENEGQLLVLLSFLLIGASALPAAFEAVTLPAVLVVLSSLFLLRPLAIWISLLGTDASPAARLFMGWFGPRGLATALFALIVVQTVDFERGAAIVHVAILAVAVSTILHGATAAPAARLFGTRLDRAPGGRSTAGPAPPELSIERGEE